MFCFPANPFMLWCLFNDQRHSQKWQPSLLKVLRPHPVLSQEKEVAAPRNTEPTSCAHCLGRVGCVVWGACKSHTVLGLGRACHSKRDLAWKRLWIIQHQKLAKVILSALLSLPPYFYTKKLLTFFEAHIFEICFRQSLMPKWRPELRPPGNFHQEMGQGWCWAPGGCAFSLTSNLGHKVVIWIIPSLQGTPPMDEGLWAWHWQLWAGFSRESAMCQLGWPQDISYPE